MNSDHIYINLNTVNNDNESPYTGFPQLSFEETRNVPILNNASEYYLSVVRFQLETSTLPVFIPVVLQGQANPNVLEYVIGMSYTSLGTTYHQKANVIFVPQNLTQPIPPVPTTSFNTEYYYLNTVQSFINMLNTTFTTVFNALYAQVVLPSNKPPFFTFDATTGRPTLYAEFTAFDEITNPNPVKIFFNNQLFTLFNSFDNEFLGFIRPNEDNYRIRVKNLNLTANIPPIGDPAGALTTYIVVESEYSVLTLMNPVQSIVFTSATLPIVQNMMSKPVAYKADTITLNNQGNNALVLPVITDFCVPLNIGYEYKNQIVYSPTSEYRLIDMYGNTSFSTIQISVWWSDGNGALHPFRLGSNCSASIKLMFRKKSVGI